MKHRDKEKLEDSLASRINGLPKWEQVCGKLIDRKLIDMTKGDISLCKYPHYRNAGRQFIDHLLTYKPDITVKEFKITAQQNGRNDICDLLKAQRENQALTDIPYMHLDSLQKLCGIFVRRGNWKTLAEDMGFTERDINSIVLGSMEGHLSSPVMEMFDILTTKNPCLKLSDVMTSLQELSMKDTAIILQDIIKTKVEEQVSTTGGRSSVSTEEGSPTRSVDADGFFHVQTDFDKTEF